MLIWVGAQPLLIAPTSLCQLLPASTLPAPASLQLLAEDCLALHHSQLLLLPPHYLHFLPPQAPVALLLLLLVTDPPLSIPTCHPALMATWLLASSKTCQRCQLHAPTPAARVIRPCRLRLLQSGCRSTKRWQGCGPWATLSMLLKRPSLVQALTCPQGLVFTIHHLLPCSLPVPLVHRGGLLRMACRLSIQGCPHTPLAMACILTTQAPTASRHTASQQCTIQACHGSEASPCCNGWVLLSLKVLSAWLVFPAMDEACVPHASLSHHPACRCDLKAGHFAETASFV